MTRVIVGPAIRARNHIPDHEELVPRERQSVSPLRSVASFRLTLGLTALFAVVALALALNATDGSSSEGSAALRDGASTPGHGSGQQADKRKGGKGGGHGLDVGFVDGQFSDNLLTSSDPAVRKKWFKRLKGANASYARINVYWSQTTGPNPPASPTDPADPSYDWTIIDDAVKSAKKVHAQVVLTVLGAPTWAEGPNRPADVRTGAWRPDAARLGDFARALAKRYSGKYNPGSGKLPAVRYYEAWNESNLPNYISPQWDGKKPVSPGIYRAMVNEFYAGIHSVSKKNRVVAGGTSPFGDKPGGKRMAPNYFWREVLCLNKKLKKQKGCAKGKNVAHIDIYATNSINGTKTKGPTSKPPHPDDSVPSNFGVLGKIFKAAQKQKTVKSAGKKMPGWSTETWYEGKPGDPRAVSAKKQAQYQEESLYVLWKQGASVVLFLQLRDTPYDPAKPGLLGFQTGVYLANDKPKPALTATQFPFVADRKSKKKVLLWGKAPASGKLTITQKGSGKSTVAKIKVKGGQVFTKTVSLPGHHKLQAKIGKTKSLPWNLK